MVSLSPFTCRDLLRFNEVNVDPFTETYGISFYMTYMARWPEYFIKAEDMDENIVGYIMGKSEGTGENWHGHVTAVSVCPAHRHGGVAAKLMQHLEQVSEQKQCYFVDLFVRKSNTAAINFYKSLGYIVYRTVLDYYSGEPDEDAYDMRKALSRDVEKKSIIALTAPVRPEDIE